MFQKEHVLWAYMLASWSGNEHTSHCNSVKFGKMDEQDRLRTIFNSEQIYNVEAMLPSTKIRYLGGCHYGVEYVKDLRITMIVDYPFGADLDKEQEFLEQQA